MAGVSDVKEEVFGLQDKSFLFDFALTMHDQVLTHIEIADGELQIIYDKVGENDYYIPYRKVTITYTLDPMKNDYSLSLIKPTEHGTKVDYSTNDPLAISDLNRWEMLMFKWDIDMWGEMTLHFNIHKGKKYRNAQLRFTPASIQYRWEE